MRTFPPTCFPYSIQSKQYLSIDESFSSDDRAPIEDDGNYLASVIWLICGYVTTYLRTIAILGIVAYSCIHHYANGSLNKLVAKWKVIPGRYFRHTPPLIGIYQPDSGSFNAIHVPVIRLYNTVLYTKSKRNKQIQKYE